MNTGELGFDHRDGVRPDLEACGRVSCCYRCVDRGGSLDRVVDLLAVAFGGGPPHPASGSGIVRNLRPDRVQRAAIEEIGAEAPRLDDGDLDTKWRQLRLHGFAEALDGELGRSIDAPASYLREAAHRSDVDDVPGVLRSHVRKNGPRHVQKPENVRRKNRFDLSGRRFFDCAEQSAPSVVDQDVDGAEPRDRSVDSGCCLPLVGNVESNR